MTLHISEEDKEDIIIGTLRERKIAGMITDFGSEALDEMQEYIRKDMLAGSSQGSFEATKEMLLEQAVTIVIGHLFNQRITEMVKMAEEGFTNIAKMSPTNAEMYSSLFTGLVIAKLLKESKYILALSKGEKDEKGRGRIR